MPTSATPKQVFDRALFNELKSLTKPKVDPAMLRRGANAIQRKPFPRGPVKKSDYPPWHVALGDRPSKRDARPGVGSLRSEADDLKRTAYETARDARLKGTTVDAPSDGKVAPTRSVPGWDELMGGRGRGAMGAQGSGGRSGAMEFQPTGGRYGPKTETPRASGGGSMANESASSWDAMVQSTGGSSKGGKGAQKGMGSRSAAPSAPKAAWELEFAGRGASQGGGGKGSGKKRRGYGNKRKSSGKSGKGGDATGGFDWGRFYS